MGFRLFGAAQIIDFTCKKVRIASEVCFLLTGFGIEGIFSRIDGFRWQILPNRQTRIPLFTALMKMPEMLAKITPCPTPRKKLGRGGLHSGGPYYEREQ